MNLIVEETPKKFNLRVAKDNMAVLLDWDIPADNLDQLVEDISSELESLGIKDPSDKEQLKKKLRRVADGNPHLADFILIEGKPPTSPQHGRVDWAGDFFDTGFVVDTKTGKINYREKAAHESVKKGTLLGRQIPVKEGEDGQDVFGESVPAEKPVEYYPKVGENVRFNMNENAYYADSNGRVRLVNDILYVDEVYSIQEDVDITTGNISHTGAVVVNRDVLTDAKIEAVGNVEVHGVVESAEIRTNGNLAVHGGITLSPHKKTIL